METKHKVEIVAEIGINHQGDMSIAKRMIHVAKGCGADTAKFQIYMPERILDREHPDIKPWWGLICKTELSYKQVEELKKECDAVGIRFLASVFHPIRVSWTEEIGVERYKIASRSMYNEPLAKAIAATGKPVLISWGHYEKSKGSPAIWKVARSNKVKKYNLYCISKYPTPLSDLDFFETDWPTGREWSKFRFKYYGFSDHTVGIGAAAMAMSLGARVIEKHFTLDRSMPGPDHVCSIEPDKLAQLCRMRDDIEEILYANTDM